MPNHIKWLYLLILSLLPLCAAAQYDPNTVTPDNAADWYQKAFDLYEDPNGFDLTEYATGDIELTPQIEQYLISQQPVIDLLKKAAQIKHCDWQFEHLDEFKISFLKSGFFFEAKKIAFLLSFKIKFDLSRGQLEEAIQDCKLLLGLSQDVDLRFTDSYLISLAIRSMAYSRLHETIETSINNPEQLREIKNLLRLDADYNYTTYNDTLTYKIQFIEKYCRKSCFQDDHIWGRRATLFPFKDFDEDFFDRNRRNCIELIQQTKKLLELPYPEGITKIEKLYDSIINKMESDLERFDNRPEDSTLTIEDLSYLQQCDSLIAEMLLSENPIYLINLETRINNHRNALYAAIVVQQIVHKTNQLPKKIPYSCPKDLFSNKPFELIETENGFKLKCQAGNLIDNETHEYEFKLPKD